MSSPDRISTHVMISSVMRGRESDREAIARVIEEQHNDPWYADDPPHEFRGISGETLSFRMAEDCDLYLLIIFPRYGTIFDGDPRSVTHQEFHHARKANPYKIEVFIAAEAKSHPDSDQLHAFIDEVSHFRDGYSPHIFHSLGELKEQVRVAVVSWDEGGANGRNAYVQAIANEYRTFRNPVTGQEMDYNATVQLRLRAKLRADMGRPEWSDDEDRKASGRRLRREARDRERERARIEVAAASPPRMLRELLAQYQRLVIIGDVGSGKSTLLKQMVHEAASEYIHTTQARLPILVTATRLGRAAIEHPGQSLAIVVGLLQQDDTRYDALRQTINRTVSEALYRGEALLLVDGLDEARAAEQTAILSLLTQIGMNQAVLASRPEAYSNQLTGWQIADLQQLGLEQRRQLVLQVFHAEISEQERLPIDGQFNRTADALLDELRRRKTDLAAWAGNPLLLTLIAVQYLRDRRLPENRARIYEFAIEDLQRQRPTNAHRYLTEHELETYLRLLALRMTETLRRDATIAEVGETYLPECAISTAIARELLERSGVLQRDAAAVTDSSAAALPHESDDKSRYEFVHTSFREYLAACALAEMPWSLRHDLVRRHCLHQAWEQVLILLVSQLDLRNRRTEADALIRLLMRADKQRIRSLGRRDPTHLALRIATRCALSRGKSLSRKLIRELQDAWWSVWRVEEHRLMTARGFVEMMDASGIKIEDIATDVAALPEGVLEGSPLVLGRVLPGPKVPSARWWLIGILIVAMIALGAAVTPSINPLASGRWSYHASEYFPAMILTAIYVFILLRNFSGLATRGRVHREMVIDFLYSDEARVLGELGDRVPVKRLLRLLQDRDATMQVAAVRALGYLGESAPIEWILLLLKERRGERVQQAAIQALGQLRDWVPVGRLLTLLADPDGHVRRAAVQVLGQLGERTPVEQLVAMLNDGVEGVRTAAIGALGQLGERTPVEQLVKLLDHPNNSIRATVIEALGQLSDVVPIEKLLSWLDDPNWHVREAAQKVLIQRTLAGEAVPVERLLDLSNFMSWHMWETAAQALGQLRDLMPTERLLVLLDDPNGTMRVMAILALGQRGDEIPVERLLTLLNDPEWLVRRAVVEVLEQLGDRVPIEWLLAVFNDSHSGVQPEAARVLASRDISTKEARQFYRAAVHPRGWQIAVLMHLIRWLSDWPVIGVVFLAQLTLIFPAIAARIPMPLPVLWLFSFTAWWQVLIIAFLCAVLYLLTSYYQARVVYSERRQEERATMLNALETVMRRQVVDTMSKSLLRGTRGE